MKAYLCIGRTEKLSQLNPLPSGRANVLTVEEYVVDSEKDNETNRHKRVGSHHSHDQISLGAS